MRRGLNKEKEDREERERENIMLLFKTSEEQVLPKISQPLWFMIRQNGILVHSRET